MQRASVNPFDAEPGTPRKKAGTGQTAMRHAIAICEQLYPGQPLILASKKTVWIPDKRGPCKACGRNLRPISTSEDVWGIADIVVVGFGIRGAAIQVTTQTKARSTVADRKRKIEAWLRETPVAMRAGSLSPTLEIWCWVSRKHMRRFVYRPSGIPADWIEYSEMWSPLIARNAA